VSSSLPRVLLCLPQMPQDPASGAARSLSTICGILAASGFDVRGIGTTASEGGANADPLSLLLALGIHPQKDSARSEGRVRSELRYTHRGVGYHLLHVGARTPWTWEPIHGRQFDRIFDEALRDFRPDILFTFGGTPGDRRRRERARRQGAKVVFGLRNEGYLTSDFFDDTIDAVLTPSQFLSDLYRRAIGLESTPIPTPIELADVVAEDHDPILFTMINPSREKGVMVVARLAEELSVRRPDIPLLFIESRGSGGLLVAAGLAGGFDLRRHENLMFSPSVPRPKDIFAPTRALLVPSVWQEAFGRVAAEALLNGIPPIVSDRGGLPEACNGAGFVMPLPPEVTPETEHPVEPEVVAPWIELIERLEGDAAFYAEEVERARQASAAYRPETLAPRYVEYFGKVAE
jgi:glycosyltransferase involved in cell wall biosynthesis